MFEPKTRKVMFFIMIGHSFGLVASVYNYNRRSAMINQILIKEFKLLAAFYFDDKFGFEKEGLVDQAMKIVQAVHRWVGAKFEEKKTQVSKAPTILGVVHDLDEYKIKIKPERKAALIDEIKKILEDGSLTPGHAGKLKGKLQKERERADGAEVAEAEARRQSSEAVVVMAELRQELLWVEQ